jgi:hypothetical protein
MAAGAAMPPRAGSSSYMKNCSEAILPFLLTS